LCRNEIRQLAHDLPIFDSLWLDALVRIGKLTSFQAEMIHLQGLESLLTGAYVIKDLIRDQGGNLEFLARKQSLSPEFLLSRWQISEQEQQPYLDRLEELKAKLQLVASLRCEKILEILQEKDSLTIVSSHQHGLNLKELLIRRGRIKSTLVVEIARQLLIGLDELHRQHLVHGDLRLENVVLLRSGKVLMKNAGLRQLMSVEGERYLDRSPECYDGFAPELAEVGNQPTYASDFYSLGCLLWELLAGKPPFIAGDPLVKIQRHQQGKMVDIRDVAPETGESLAELIQQLTLHQPHERPKSAAEAMVKFLGAHAGWNMGLRGLAHRVCEQASRFETPLQRMRFNPAFVLVPLLVVFAGGAFYLGDVGKKAQAVFASRWELLTAVDTSKKEVSNIGPSPAITVKLTDLNYPLAENSVQETVTEGQIPLPDAQGKILLSGGKTYAVRDIDFGQALEISSDSNQPATIYLTEKPWNLTAPKVSLRNLMLVSSALSDGGKLIGQQTELPSLVNLQVQEFSCQRVIWQGPSVANFEVSVFKVTQHRQHMLNQLATTRLNLDQVGFTGAAHALQFVAGSCQVEMEDVLKTGRGSLLVNEVAESKSRQIQSMKFRHVTLREADYLLEIRGQVAGDKVIPKYQITAERNVWGLQAGHDLCVLKQSAALSMTPLQIQQIFSWTGSENLIAPETEFCLGVWSKNQSGAQIRIFGLEPGEGFLQTGWSFQGASLRKLDENTLMNYAGPKLSSVNPGFRLQKSAETEW
jgi:hypothetical protein